MGLLAPPRGTPGRNFSYVMTQVRWVHPYFCCEQTLTLTNACSLTPLILTVTPRSERDRASASAAAEKATRIDADLSVASICPVQREPDIRQRCKISKRAQTLVEWVYHPARDNPARFADVSYTSRVYMRSSSGYMPLVLA